ncbi:MAG TPA: hypothetical protein VF221_16190 [Chloroflexota bacterium]
MVRRIIILVCISIFLTLSAYPRGAQAKGMPLKGQQITGAQWIVGHTGDCICDEQWYTLGLRPGPVTVDAHLLFSTMKLQPTYSLLIWFNQGETNLKFAEKTCPRALKICNKVLGFTTHIAHAGVYYLLVKGRNAEGITYSIRVRGKLYRLHCGKTC